MMNQRPTFHHIAVLDNFNMINGLDLNRGTQKIGFQSKISNLQVSFLFFYTVPRTVAPPFFESMDFQRPSGGGRNAKIFDLADLQCPSS